MMPHHLATEEGTVGGFLRAAVQCMLRSETSSWCSPSPVSSSMSSVSSCGVHPAGGSHIVPIEQVQKNTWNDRHAQLDVSSAVGGTLTNSTFLTSFESLRKANHRDATLAAVRIRWKGFTDLRLGLYLQTILSDVRWHDGFDRAALIPMQCILSDGTRGTSTNDLITIVPRADLLVQGPASVGATQRAAIEAASFAALTVDGLLRLQGTEPSVDDRSVAEAMAMLSDPTVQCTSRSEVQLGVAE